MSSQSIVSHGSFLSGFFNISGNTEIFIETFLSKGFINSVSKYQKNLQNKHIMGFFFFIL